MPKTRYKNEDAIAYAKNYCGKKSNSCGIFLEGVNKSDCAHFIAHCLQAGGITIKNPSSDNQLCPQGLAVRNVDLVAELRRLDGLYENVKEIGLTDAIVGDIGFLDRPDRPTHAFMICAPVDLRPMPPPPVKVYAHSASRCGTPMDAQWRQWYSTIFRLTNG